VIAETAHAEQETAGAKESAAQILGCSDEELSRLASALVRLLATCPKVAEPKADA
jgi:hypothetical protein